MTNISLWQQGLQEPVCDTNRLATNLYGSCLQLFLGLVKAHDCDPSAIRRLRYRAQEFRLWGTAFDAHGGELDEILLDVPRLKRVLLPMLSGLGETLANLSRNFHQDEILTDLHSQISVLKMQVSDMMNEVTAGDHELSEQLNIFLDELGSESSTSCINEVEELLQDIQTYNSCLYELGDTVLKDSKEKLDGKKNQMQDVMSRQFNDNAALPYTANILEAYPSIDKVFARRLGEANHLRYIRLQDRRDSAMARADHTELSAEESQPSPSLGEVSRYLSNPDSSVPYSASIATFASSVGDGGKSLPQLHRGIPRMPNDQSWGTEFSCTVCGDRLSNVWSTEQWVRHVYRDLQPYICSFADCKSGIETFVSKRQWAEHELTEHRGKNQEARDQSSKDECPFCRNCPASTKFQYVSHLARHMQQISHAAIPLSAMSENDVDLEISEDEELSGEIENPIPAKPTEPQQYFSNFNSILDPNSERDENKPNVKVKGELYSNIFDVSAERDSRPSASDTKAVLSSAQQVTPDQSVLRSLIIEKSNPERGSSKSIVIDIKATGTVDPRNQAADIRKYARSSTEWRTNLYMMVYVPGGDIKMYICKIDTASKINVLSQQVVKSLEMKMETYYDECVTSISSLIQPIGRLMLDWHVKDKKKTYSTDFVVLNDDDTRGFDVWLSENTAEEIGFHFIDDTVWFCESGDHQLSCGKISAVSGAPENR